MSWASEMAELEEQVKTQRAEGKSATSTVPAAFQF
jgi:hypothetical protein